LLTAKFNDARLLRALFLFFHNGLPRFLLFFGPRHIDRSLRCDLKCEDHTAKTEQDSVPHLRSVLKYPATPRESGLGWMARRERRGCPQRPVRSEQRSQTAQDALALRVAPLLRLSGVARRLQTAAGVRTPRALERRKIGSNAAWLGILTDSLGS
jgi:hypothetical protein